MSIQNKTTGLPLPYLVVSAETILKRMAGLLGTKTLDIVTTLHIVPCNSIHTFGMRYPIDIVFLNKRQKLIKIIRNLPPNRLIGVTPEAYSVLEFFGGTFGGADVGDILEIQRDRVSTINMSGIRLLFYWPFNLFLAILLFILISHSFSDWSHSGGISITTLILIPSIFFLLLLNLKSLVKK